MPGGGRKKLCCQAQIEALRAEGSEKSEGGSGAVGKGGHGVSGESLEGPRSG
jgi:hypothetical protein